MPQHSIEFLGPKMRQPLLNEQSLVASSVVRSIVPKAKYHARMRSVRWIPMVINIQPFITSTINMSDLPSEQHNAAATIFNPKPRDMTVSTILKPGVESHTFMVSSTHAGPHILICLDAHVHSDLMQGIVWTAALLALLAVIIRLYSRFRGPRRLFWDDAVVIFAQMMVLTTAGLWQWAAKFMYYVLGANTELIANPSLPKLFSDLQNWLHVQFAVELLYYTTLVLVKLSILLFLRRLGQNVQGKRYMWWLITVFSVIVYVVSIGNMQYRCLLGSVEDAITYCTSPEASYFTMSTLRANMALDVLSDFLSKHSLFSLRELRQ